MKLPPRRDRPIQRQIREQVEAALRSVGQRPLYPNEVAKLDALRLTDVSVALGMIMRWRSYTRKQ